MTQDNKKKILTAKELMAVRVHESGSKMVSLKEIYPVIQAIQVKEDMKPYTGDDIFVREELVSLLQKAYVVLQQKAPGSNFRIQYGYRHPNVQASYFKDRYKVFQASKPTAPVEELIELTHTQVAFPEVAGHPTGGAVDITIIDQGGEKIDMGTDIADYEHPEKCYTYSPLISSQQLRNRMLLADIMIQVGFAPFNGEWWHFSYGDREWACFYGFKETLFDQIDFKSV